VATIRTTCKVKGRAVAEPILFDARIEELLREVAADPKSRLLRVPRPARLGVVLGRRPSIGVATAGLGAAERELVALHRGELSYLLRKLAVVRLFESPAAATNHARVSISGQAPLAVDRGDWVESARGSLMVMSVDAPPDPGRELLERCVRNPDEIGSVAVTDVAAAANVLEPTDQARIYTALSLAHDPARIDEARSVLLDVLAGQASPANASLAAADIGWLESLCGNSRAACDGYRRAVELLHENTLAACSWLATSFDCVDRANVESAARSVDHWVGREDPALQSFVDLLRRQRTSRALLPASGSLELASHVMTSSTEKVWLICDAYINS
jgi:hypothetical protein